VAGGVGGQGAGEAGGAAVNWLMVVVGAAIGAPLRYLTDRAVQARHDSVFPWGTFVVNAAGSLVLGAVAGASVSSGSYALLGTGLCGALTTYSTFSYETLRLAERGWRFLAVANVAASLLVGLGSVFLGLELARALTA
jgi:CrcB protein